MEVEKGNCIGKEENKNCLDRTLGGAGGEINVRISYKVGGEINIWIKVR
jgi:hypothetical protein